MESGFKPEDAKEADNTALNLALAICFSGLFLMIVAAVSALAVLTIGGAPIVANLSYLVAVAFYLGIVVISMIGVAYSYAESDAKERIAARPNSPVPLKRSVAAPPFVR
jgi:hypothetical protein